MAVLISLVLGGAEVGAYTIFDLGSLGSANAQALGINDAGQVVGQSFTGVGAQRAFLWSPTTPNATSGSMVDLGTLGGHDSGATAINGVGQVVGSGYTSVPGEAHAFLWTPNSPNGTSGSMLDLGSLPGGLGHDAAFAVISIAFGVNAFGQVVGYSYSTYTYHARPFLWTPTTANGSSGTMVDLGTLGGAGIFNRAFAINDSGQVVGESVTGTGETHAFLWTPSSPNGTSGSMVDLGTLPGGYFSSARGINGAGEVVGKVLLAAGNKSLAFLWKPTTANGSSGTMVDLGTLGGGDYTFASGINAAGKVVGMSYTSAAEIKAFLWSPAVPNGMTGTMFNLGSLGALWSYASGINAVGQITGYTFDSYHALLWSPSCPSTSAIESFLNSLPLNHFCGSSTAQQTSNLNWFLMQLALAQTKLNNGNCPGAIAHLSNVLQKADGCGTSPDSNDKLCNCGDQAHLQLLVNAMLSQMTPGAGCCP